MKKPEKHIKLSLIVPCYNVQEFLPKCLDSILSQTLKDIEIICINDGSPDDCLRILKEYHKKYGDKITIIDKKNEGVWQARLDGIKKAHGEYICFIDSDDYIAPEYAEKLYETAIKYNADIAICGFDRIDYSTGKRYSHEMCKPKHRKISINNNPGLLLEINTAPWNKIYKTNLLKKLPKLMKTPSVLEDVALLQLIYLSADIISFTPKSLYRYIVHDGSAIKTIKTSDLTHGQVTLKEIRNLYAKNKSIQFLDYIDANAFLHLGISLMFRLYESKTPNFKKILKDNTSFLNNNFPNWNKNQYLNLNYIKNNNGSKAKVYIIKKFYNYHLFRLFLASYNIIVNKLKIDIKW